MEKVSTFKVKVGKAKSFVFLAGTDWELALRVKFWGFPDYREEVVFHIDKINAKVEGQALSVALNPKLLKEFTQRKPIFS